MGRRKRKSDKPTEETSSPTPTPRARTAPSARRPHPAIPQIRRITTDLNNLVTEQEASVLSTPLLFNPPSIPDGPPHLPLLRNPKFAHYEEGLMRLMDRFDSIDSDGVAPVREARKEGIAKVQAYLKTLDDYKAKEAERWLKEREEGANEEVRGEEVWTEEKNGGRDVVVVGTGRWKIAGAFIAVGFILAGVLLGLLLDYSIMLDDIRDALSF
ncbi:hypothetical protein HK104_010425 [Borealophlyctis nickersoniae]|nr:hypothetical protein HK104_010425 [Borealophlyctis nickersoniae]